LNAKHHIGLNSFNVLKTRRKDKRTWQGLFGTNAQATTNTEQNARLLFVRVVELTRGGETRLNSNDRGWRKNELFFGRPAGESDTQWKTVTKQRATTVVVVQTGNHSPPPRALPHDRTATLLCSSAIPAAVSVAWRQRRRRRAIHANSLRRYCKNRRILLESWSLNFAAIFP